ncbi:MAG: NAD(P)-dependent oxidoreductase, partial [Actinomycetia bacterium]|nr:NAD(P)-dependent oxidoreductase [Actinomycetes bacterium]
MTRSAAGGGPAPSPAGRKVFITGASGFIGRVLAKRLRALGDTVIGVDLQADRDAGVVAGDIAEPGDWQDHAAGADLVIHTAAIVSNMIGMDEQWRVSVVGARNALDAAVRGNASRFLHLSSVRAFSDVGFPNDVTEEYPVRPDGNPYVDTKIACEQVVLQAHAAGELAATIVRPGDVYGPGSRPWTIIPVESIKRNQFLLPAMGKGIFSPVYVDDLVDGIVLAADNPAGAGHVFTISGGVGVPCKEFFGHYSRMVGKGKLTVVPTPVALAIAGSYSNALRLRGRRTEINPVSVRYFTRTGTYS